MHALGRGLVPAHHRAAERHALLRAAQGLATDAQGPLRGVQPGV